MLSQFFIPQQKNNYKPYLLRHKALIVYTLILLLTNIFSGLLGFPQNRVFADSIDSGKIILLTNDERTKLNLPALEVSAQLTSAAFAKANNMFEKQYWNHFGPDGETPWQFINDSGYSYYFAGENLAKGFKTPEGIVQAWMASPTHRENIISPNYKDIGIAVVEGTLEGEQVYLVVQMFGNTTKEVFNPLIETPEIEVVESSDDNAGEISSISIVKPDNGSILTDPNIDIEGNVEGTFIEGVDILINENETAVGTTETESDGTWAFDKKSDWEEGNHTINAQIENLESSVTFFVDSTPPQIDSKSVLVEKTDDGNIKISAIINDAQAEVNIVADSKINIMLFEQDGFFHGTIKEGNYKKVIIVATDVNGNSSTLDITTLLKDSNGAIKGISSIISGIELKTIVGSVIAMFVLFLLILELYHYSKLRILHQRSGYILTSALWLFLLISGLLVGFGGNII